MSNDGSGENEYISIRATSGFQDDDEALETLVQLKELEFGDIFTKSETSLNNEEGEGIHIQFSNDNNFNQLLLSTDESGDVVIALSLIQECIPESSDVFSKLYNKIDGIKIDNIDLIQVYDIPFSSLDLPIKQDSEYNVTGIKISEEPADYVIRAGDNGETTVYGRWRDLPEDTDEIISDIGSKQIEQSDELIGSLR